MKPGHAIAQGADGGGFAFADRVVKFDEQPRIEIGAAEDAAAAANGLGPRWDSLREPWLAEIRELLAEAHLPMPADSAFLSTGKTGVHTEHMGYILSDLQYLQRAYPGGVW